MNGHWMSGRLLTQRFAPPKPDEAILWVSDKPVTKPSEPKHEKNQKGQKYDENLTSPELPAQEKWCEHEPGCIETNSLA